jgi:membrane associated rhomboid family serine protease
MTLLLLVVLGFTTWQGLQQPVVMMKYLFSTERFRLRREYLRLISPAFLHASWGHFFGNALTLYFFAGTLESRIGPGPMLATFFLSVAGGHLICLLLHPHRDYRALGASGGALGVLFSTILLMPGMTLLLFPLPIPIPGWLYAIAYLAYTVTSLRGDSGVSHEAHLGGMLSGVGITLLHAPRVAMAQPLLLSAILLLGGGGLWYFHANPGRVPGFLGFRLRGLVQDIQRRRHAQHEDQLDALLDKVAREGLHSLSSRERATLEAASKRRGGQRR